VSPSRPRKRPARRRRPAPPPPAPREFRQARARATYHRILEAALELYAERGYHRTQTPDVAERAGISVGGLYRYFDDKHQIFVELMHRMLEANRRTQDAMLEDFEKRWESGEAGVHEAAETMVEWTWNGVKRAPRDLVRTYMAMGYQDETFAALRDEYDRYERAALAGVLERLLPPGRRSTPRAAATLLDLLVETLAIWAHLHPGTPSRGVKEAAKELVVLYLSGQPAAEPRRRRS